MTNAHATAIIKQNTASYNAIAESFSMSRNRVWSDLSSFTREMAIRAGVKVLDAGCGNGRLVDLFEGMDVSYCGIDTSEKLLAYARERAKKRGVNAEFLKADVRELPYADNYFEYVFCIAVLHHLPSPAVRLKAMKEIARVLAPSGKLFMMNWNLWRLTIQGKSVWKYLFSKKCHGALKGRGLQDVMTLFGDENTPLYYYAFRLGDLLHLAKQAGLVVEQSFYIKQGKQAHWWSARNSMLMAKKRSC